MPYGPWDEYFVHQLPRTLDHVADTDESWSDRCYFNLHSPDGDAIVVTGYGNNPNTQSAHGYGKVSLPDGRRCDVDAVRKVTVDRGDLYAGPMRWTCVEPLRRWRLEMEPNASGLSWDLEYTARNPLWEFLPVVIRDRGTTVVDMQHIQQSGTYRGWIELEGQRTDINDWHGSRDRTFGMRRSDKLDFWVWFSAQFADRSMHAYLWENSAGVVQSMDGGICYVDGRLSERLVRLVHDVTFDGDLKRSVSADLLFVDAAGHEYKVQATTSHPDAAVYYGHPDPGTTQREGALSWAAWKSSDGARLQGVNQRALSLDQVMRFELDGMVGQGIFEIFASRRGPSRYPNWVPPRASK